jgi:hypothetical protein
MTIPDHQALPILVPEIGIASGLLRDFELQGCHQHPLATILEDLGEAILGG